MKDVEEFKKEMEEERDGWIRWKEETESFFLMPDVLAKYFINPGPEIEFILEKAKNKEVRLVTTTSAVIDTLYALDDDELEPDKLARLLKLVEISNDPPALKNEFTKKDKRRDHLRKLAETSVDLEDMDRMKEKQLIGA